MERKHANAIQLLEEKNKIELEKYAEKRAVADKLERDRWKEMETKKIQVSVQDVLRNDAEISVSIIAE